MRRRPYPWAEIGLAFGIITMLVGLAFTGVFILTSNAVKAKGGKYSTSRACLPADLKRTLAEIERRWGKVRIVSTMRRGAVIAGSGRPSQHARCRAVDFHPAPGTRKAVAAWLKANHPGGVGTYGCAMTHLHIDLGRKARWHHCVDSRGRRVR